MYTNNLFGLILLIKDSKKDILQDGKFRVLATVQSTNTYHPVAMLHCKGTVKHLVYGNIKYGSGSQLENPTLSLFEA